MRALFLYFLLFALLSTKAIGRFQATSSPEITYEGLSIRAMMSLPSETVRLEFNPSDGKLYFASRNGDIFQINLLENSYIKVQDSTDHGIQDLQGLEISEDGHFFVVGNKENEEEATNTVSIKRATLSNENWIWELVAITDPYPLSNTAFDHIMNAIVISPDQKYLYINSGSRTDHGEVHSVNGKYPGLREAPLTAKILRIPADTTNIQLKNDLDDLHANGYVFAEGIRNSFSLAFDGEGNLFGVENSGDRDDSEEINWLREGHHYGFPWEMGGNNTPMQFSDFDPDNDPFIPSNSTAANLGTFYNDPNYPSRPEGVTFTSGLKNFGPDADTFRDTTDGLIKDASQLNTYISSFSAHLSPVGLSFDTKNEFGEIFTGDGFMLSFSGGEPGDAFLLDRMNYHGEDLIHLTFTKTDDSFSINATSIARGFLNPIDTEIVSNKLYLIEFRNDSWLNADKTTQLFEITFPLATSVQRDNEIPTKIQLLQNYPNPFNPSTNIQFSLQESANVSLIVYDAIGRIVSILEHGKLHSGLHLYTFDASGLATGIYFYQLTLNDVLHTTKSMTLIK